MYEYLFSLYSSETLCTFSIAFPQLNAFFSTNFLMAAKHYTIYFINFPLKFDFSLILDYYSSNGREARNRAEKNRRDKLNKSIQELAGRVRNVAGSSKRIDKTGILRFSAHGLRIEYGKCRIKKSDSFSLFHSDIKQIRFDNFNESDKH